MQQGADAPSITASPVTPVTIRTAPHPVLEDREVAQAPLRDATSSGAAWPAASVARFVPTLRLLALLMAVTGIGVGIMQWREGSQLSGLWTLGVGSVGAFGLYVFAEVVRTVAVIANAVTRQEG